MDEVRLPWDPSPLREKSGGEARHGRRTGVLLSSQVLASELQPTGVVQSRCGLERWDEPGAEELWADVRNAPTVSAREGSPQPRWIEAGRGRNRRSCCPVRAGTRPPGYRPGPGDGLRWRRQGRALIGLLGSLTARSLKATEPADCRTKFEQGTWTPWHGMEPRSE